MFLLKALSNYSEESYDRTPLWSKCVNRSAPQCSESKTLRPFWHIRRPSMRIPFVTLLGTENIAESPGPQILWNLAHIQNPHPQLRARTTLTQRSSVPTSYNLAPHSVPSSECSQFSGSPKLGEMEVFVLTESIQRREKP